MESKRGLFMTPTVVGHGTGVLIYQSRRQSADVKNSLCGSEGVCGTSPNVSGSVLAELSSTCGRTQN